MSERCVLGFPPPPKGQMVFSSSGTAIQVDRVVQAMRSVKGVRALMLNLGIDWDIAPDNYQELLEQLLRDRGNDTTKRVRTEQKNCANPNADVFGKGAVKTDKLIELWNKNGRALEKRLQRLQTKVNTTFDVHPSSRLVREVFDKWKPTLGHAYNCIEGSFEENTHCKKPPGPRCKVPATVLKCTARKPL